MKLKKLNKKILVLLTAFILLSTISVYAQPEDGGDGPGDQDTPIDGGITLLIAAGVGYGVKKVRDGRKK